MRRARVVSGAVAVVLLLGTGVQSAAAEKRRSSSPNVVASQGRLTDLSTATADATDGAKGTAVAVATRGRTRVLMLIWGLDRTASGMVHGAHVHVGSCVAGSGATAGPHYNSTGGALIDATTEVWLDFTISPFGFGYASATVPFVIPAGGARSIVIHAAPTAPDGTAGARLACLPLEF